MPENVRKKMEEYRIKMEIINELTNYLNSVESPKVLEMIREKIRNVFE